MSEARRPPAAGEGPRIAGGARFAHVEGSMGGSFPVSRPAPRSGALVSAIWLAAALALAAAPGASSALPFTVTGRTDIACGDGPEWVRLFDLNGDGHQDLVTANLYGDDVTVLLSDGAGGFLPGVSHAAGDGPFTVAPCDLNNDLKIDLIAANTIAGTISVLIGNGDGTYAPATHHVSGPGTAVAAIGYLNPDGNMDVVTANFYGNTVSVFLGDGSGGFLSKTDYPTGLNPNWVALGDFNRDGTTDLITANYGASTVSLLEGNGDGTYGAPYSFPCGANPLTLALADLDGDDVLDVVTANYGASTVSVLLGTGKMVLKPRTDYPTGAGPVTVNVGDLNFDGVFDVATSNDADNSVSLMLGNGTGGLLPRTDYAVGGSPYAVTIGDANGDGETDLVTANFATDDLSILSGNVPGGFQVGAPAVDFTALDQNGVARSLHDYLGQWVVVDVSAVWCGPCNFMANTSQNVYNTWNEAPALPLEYLTLLVDGSTPGRGATQGAAYRWGYRYELTRPVLHPAGRSYGQIHSWFLGFRFNAYPTVVIIDPTGVIRYAGAGAFDGQDLVDKIALLASVPTRPLAAGSPAPPPPPPPPPGSGVRDLWHALTGADLEVGYGGSTSANALVSDPYPPFLEAAPPPVGSYLVATPPSHAGMPGGAWLYVSSSTDSLTATESIDVLVGSFNIQDPLPYDEPWQVTLKNVTWPDGMAREALDATPKVYAILYDATTQTPTFIATAIAPQVTVSGNDIVLTGLPFASAVGIDSTFNGFQVTGIRLKHVADVGAVGVGHSSTATLEFAAPRPNPASRLATLEWSVPRSQPASLVVFDIAGRAVRTLVEGDVAAGRRTSVWDLRDASGERVAPGVYFARLRSPGIDQTRRLVVIE